MLEVFRVDAESQLQVLEAGLLALKRRVAATEQFDACVCASNSLKDAATMVGYGLGASVAESLETCFTALQRRRILNAPPTVETITRGVDLLARIVRTPDVAASPWAARTHPQVDTFVASVRTLCNTRPTAIASRPGSPLVTRTAPPNASRPVPAPPPPVVTLPPSATATLPRTAATPPPVTAAPTPPKPAAPPVVTPMSRPVPPPKPVAPPVITSAKPPPAPPQMAKPAPPPEPRSMPVKPPPPPRSSNPTSTVKVVPLIKTSLSSDPLQKFSRETEMLADGLTTDLLELQNDPAATAVLDSCANTIRAMVTAAHEVEMHAPLMLAQSLEDCFEAAQQGRMRLRLSGIDVLLRGVDLFVRMTRQGQRPGDLQPELRLFLAAVKVVLDGVDGAPVAAAAPAPPMMVTMPQPAAPATAAPPPPPEPLSLPELEAIAEAAPATRLPPAATNAVLDPIAAVELPPVPEPPPRFEDPEEPRTEIVEPMTMADLHAAAVAAEIAATVPEEERTEIVPMRTMVELRRAAEVQPVQYREAWLTNPDPVSAPGTLFEAKLAENSDATMLELFQIEAERLIHDLATALAALQRDPSAPDLLEPCMLACQSLKGATRMIGLPVGVSLSHALLECFIAAQERRITLHQSGIGLLLQSSELLANIARKPEAEFGQWGGELGAEIEVFLAALKRLRDGVDSNAPAASAALDDIGTPPPAMAEMQQGGNVPVLGDIDRATLLDLFHGEGQTLAKDLSSGLLALQIDPLAPDHLEACMRAAHSFKGASRIVGLTTGVNLSRALEECFVAAQHGRLTLRPSSLTVLKRGAELIDRMARTEEADFDQWNGKRRAEVEMIVAALQRVRATGEQSSTSDNLRMRMRG